MKTSGIVNFLLHASVFSSMSHVWECEYDMRNKSEKNRTISGCDLFYYVANWEICDLKIHKQVNSSFINTDQVFSEDYISNVK